MKIGIQILAYNCSNSFENLIQPFLKLKNQFDIKIWVGSGQFKEYAELGYKDLNHSTEVLLDDLLLKGDIDLREVSNLTAKLDVPGGDLLKNANKNLTNENYD